MVVFTKGGGSSYLVFPAVIITGICGRYLLLVCSAVLITGNVGGNYYWYGQRKIILVFSAKKNNTGIFGGK